MNINQSCHCDYDQGKQHTSDHLLPHALPDVHLTRSSVQVWIFIVLAAYVPDSWECNQTSHEKTGMCLINQPAPEGKACNQVPRSEKKEVYYPSTFYIYNIV